MKIDLTSTAKASIDLTSKPADPNRLKFRRCLPHSRQGTLFMTMEEMSHQSPDVFNPDLFGTPEVGADGEIRMPSRQPVFKRAPCSSYVCAIDDRTGYGWTTPAVCIARAIHFSRWRGITEDAKTLEELVEVTSSKDFRHCPNCPLISKWMSGYDSAEGE